MSAENSKEFAKSILERLQFVITSVRMVKVARLQSEFLHERIVWAANLFRKCSEISPKCLSLYSVGQKKSAKFPPNYPPNFPAKNQKNHRRASAGAQGERMVLLAGTGGMQICGFSCRTSGEKWSEIRSRLHIKNQGASVWHFALQCRVVIKVRPLLRILADSASSSMSLCSLERLVGQALP